MIVPTDESKKEWVALCRETPVGDQWTKEESVMYINILELKAVHLALLKFIRTCPNKDFHVQMDNMVALTYLVKMGRISNQQMTAIFKRI